MIELKEGMTIYAEGYSGTLQKLEITRTTKTQALAMSRSGCEFRFNKLITETMHFYEKGAVGYNKTLFYIANEELEQRYYFQNLVNAYKKIEPEKLTKEQLKAIINIAKGKQ